MREVEGFLNPMVKIELDEWPFNMQNVESIAKNMKT
jgi:hypothetical protein